MEGKNEEHVVKERLRVKENDRVSNEADNSKLIKEKKEDNWITPKHTPIDYLLKNEDAVKKKERKNSDRHELLKDNDDDEKHEKKTEIIKVSK